MFLIIKNIIHYTYSKVNYYRPSIWICPYDIKPNENENRSIWQRANEKMHKGSFSTWSSIETRVFQKRNQDCATKDDATMKKKKKSRRRVARLLPRSLNALLVPRNVFFYYFLCPYVYAHPISSESLSHDIPPQENVFIMKAQMCAYKKAHMSCARMGQNRSHVDTPASKYNSQPIP